MKYQDVVIHTNHAIFGNEAIEKEFPPIGERIDLSKDIWVGRLEWANVVMDTSEPNAFGVTAPWRQFAQLYAFVRELGEQAEIYRWDDDNRLSSVIALSRLVHPTSTGFQYAARVGFEADGIKRVYPARIVGISKEAFLSQSRKRDWLTKTDANVLRDLVPSLTKKLPKRVHNALWHHEYAIRTYYVDHRWTLVCTGLEALVHTDRHGSTAQFKRRVPRLAVELGINISETEAETAYDARSRLAHGASFLGGPDGPTPEQLNLYDRLEDTLRLAVLRGLRDDSFASVLQDDAQIRSRWPIRKCGL